MILNFYAPHVLIRSRYLTSLLVMLVFFVLVADAQLPPVFTNGETGTVRSSSLTTTYLSPVRVVWISDDTGTTIKNSDQILVPGIGQADLNKGKYLTLINKGEVTSGIILDFGREIQGGIEIVTTINNRKPAGRVRIRFGESVAETMSEVVKDRATNDHAMRDFEVTLPWLGRLYVGESGFRFVRIDFLDPDATLEIKEVSAAFSFRDIPYFGSFNSSDRRLNDIWMTGAYTVHLNMQEYLWDGIKRDRLVWVGDMHPEVMVINSVFGYNDVVPKSLDLARDLTPLPGWMNGISSYSMWWVMLHRDWYYYQGNLAYLKEQKSYLSQLLRYLATKIDGGGRERLDGNRFLDWPSKGDTAAVHAGLQSMMVMTFKAGAELCEILGDKESKDICLEATEKLRRHQPQLTESKQAAALLALSDLVPSAEANRKVLSQDGVRRMSTFYGYYMLQARALAGDYQGAIENIRSYWGGMLDLGATTFWEDFNIDWLNDAGRIDEIVPEGKIDIHGAYGDHCYVSYRHSLCHGWAAGPTAWLTEHVLGVQVVEPASRTLRIEPRLGDLDWVEGTFPTPWGVVELEHRKLSNGTVRSRITAPKEVKILMSDSQGQERASTDLPQRGLCAHRGAMATHPENTLPAFREAVKSGAHMVEFDVRLTKDHQLVVIHDPTVDRTTNGSGKVAEMTLEEIRSLDAGSWKSTAFRGEKIPLLQEVLDEMPVNVWLNVHLKEAGLTAKLVTEMLARNDRLHQAFIAAGADAAEMARSIAPEVMICNMDRMDSPVNYLKKTFEMKADFIQLNGKIVPAFRDYAIELKSKGVRINYFGTDKPDEIIRLFDDGIDFPLVNDIISTIQVAVESGIEPVTPVFRTKK